MEGTAVTAALFALVYTIEEQSPQNSIPRCDTTPFRSLWVANCITPSSRHGYDRRCRRPRREVKSAETTNNILQIDRTGISAFTEYQGVSRTDLMCIGQQTLPIRSRG